MSAAIHIESGVSGRTEEPMVTLTWGAEGAQLTVAEARQHALRILEAAEAAESDALLWRWLRDVVHVDDPAQRAQALGEFRTLRG